MMRFFVLVFFIFPALALAQVKVPELWGHRVHDDAHILSTGTAETLEQALKTFEDSTTNQIAILIVQSLNDEPIEMFGIRVAEAWKLGTEGRDNGVIILVAVDDRKMRIEVGQGLEGPLPDVICNRIIRNEMAPNFRRGDYDAGLIATVDGVTKAIKGEYKSDGRRVRGERGRSSVSGLVIFMIILFLIIRNRRNRGGGAGWSAASGWFIGSAMGRGFGGGGGGGGSWGGGGGSFGGGGSSGSW